MRNIYSYEQNTIIRSYEILSKVYAIKKVKYTITISFERNIILHERISISFVKK